MYKEALVKTIDKGIEVGFLSEELKTFDLERLGSAIKEERDFSSHILVCKLFTIDIS